MRVLQHVVLMHYVRYWIIEKNVIVFLDLQEIQQLLVKEFNQNATVQLIVHLIISVLMENAELSVSLIKIALLVKDASAIIVYLYVVVTTIVNQKKFVSEINAKLVVEQMKNVWIILLVLVINALIRARQVQHVALMPNAKL